MSNIKELRELLTPDTSFQSEDWNLRVVSSGDCQSYIIWNQKNKEALLIDPKQDDWASYESFKKQLQGYLWLGVIDTHTHADHISAASHAAELLSAPLIMHSLSPSSRVHVRISHKTSLPSHSSPISFFPTPGHTHDAMSVLWGPFLFTGDTVLFDDVGRDDLPSGDPSAHYESLQVLKSFIRPETLVCPGHDFKGGRIFSWGSQLKNNSSLTQDRESYIREAAAFEAPAPALFKKSLTENFR